MKHIMIDLETFGTHPGCVVRSIGAKEFTPKGSTGENFYINLESTTQLEKGLKVERETVLWWEQQSVLAQQRVVENQEDTFTGLVMFADFIKKTKASYMWSHGAGFDIPLLEILFHKYNLTVPWKYTNVRDTRTVFDIVEMRLSDIPRSGIEHDALEDALHQVKVLQKAYKQIKEWKDAAEK